MSAVVAGSFFLSYSRVDAGEFALRLADRLTGGPPSYPVWVDQRDLHPGEDWDEQIVEAIRACRAVLFVMTADSVGPESGCKPEWVRALKYKKPVIPLRLHAEAESPYRLGSRQYVDFGGDVVAGLARLREHLAWTSTPEGVLQELRTRLADAGMELPRVEPSRRPLVEGEIAELRRRIEVQQRLIDNPDAVQEQTSRRIETGLERERQPEKPVSVERRTKFVNPPPTIAPGYFQDRHVETGLVADFLRTPGLRVMTVVGRGGVGKTAMVCRLLKALEAGRLPDEPGELSVDGIVYLSPVGAHPVSFPNVFADLCRLLPDPDAERLGQRYRDPQETPAALMLALLEAFPAGRYVLLLDNFEDVVDAATGAVTDPALEEAVRTVLTAPEHPLKLIVTTRVAARALLLTEPARQQPLNLDDGLASPYAETVLRAMDPDGSRGLKTAPEELLGRARERTRGYPRALEAFAAILAADRDTTLPELLAETAALPDNVVAVLVGEAFNRLDPLAQQVMQALAVFGVPVPAVAVDYLLQPYRAAVDAAPVLARLVNMQFVRRDAGRYYLHPVDRDYARQRISAGDPDDRDAAPPPFTQAALLHRAADYFAQTRTPRETWKTLDDLASQLAEFDLRCQAGDYDEAAQLLLDIAFDYLNRWGHYRLTLGLHRRLHGHLTDRWTHAAHLGSLGNCYAALGQTAAAIEHHRQALAIDREIGHRRGEAAALGNLGLCYDDLGQTAAAIEHYRQALAIDRETGYRRGEAAALGNLGNCYADLGQTAAAIEHYRQALAIARETGYRQGEAADLGNLGNCYATLGQTAVAIEHYRQALAIDREIGYRRGEAHQRLNLGEAYADQGDWVTSVRYLREAVQVADDIGYVQVQSEARLVLAQTHLLAGDRAACREAAVAAVGYDYPPSRARVQLVLGIAVLRQGDHVGARQAFTAALAHADTQLQQTSTDYQALDSKGLALCGLALTDGNNYAAQAGHVFRAARTITADAGTVARTLHLFDAIATSDRAGILAGVRPATDTHPAQGQGCVKVE